MHRDFGNATRYQVLGERQTHDPLRSRSLLCRCTLVLVGENVQWGWLTGLMACCQK